jgi:hypothetical protein
MHTYNVVLGQYMTATTSSAVAHAAQNFRDVFLMLYVYAYRMFSRADNGVSLDNLVSPLSDVSVRVGRAVYGVVTPYAVFNAALCVYAQFLNELELVLKRSVGMRDNTRCIDESLRRLHEITEETDVAARVRTPWLLRDHLGAILGVFFVARQLRLHEVPRRSNHSVGRLYRHGPRGVARRAARRNLPPLRLLDNDNDTATCRQWRRRRRRQCHLWRIRTDDGACSRANALLETDNAQATDDDDDDDDVALRQRQR